MSLGVYIKGMEMPKEGNWITLRIFPDGQCFLYDWCGNDFDFMEYLTAIPVPPHGRLIDADALDMQLSFIAEAEEQIYGRGNWRFAGKCRSKVDEATTVIPAEEE